MSYRVLNLRGKSINGDPKKVHHATNKSALTEPKDKSKLDQRIKNMEPLSVYRLSPLFHKIISLYKNKYDFDLSYMSLKVSDVPLNTHGNPTNSITVDQFGGCHTLNKFIAINKYLSKAVIYYTHKYDYATYIKTLKTVLAHELAHEIWLISPDKFKQDILQKSEKENFSTVYTKTIDKSYHKYKEEVFCEYLAGTVIKSVEIEPLSEQPMSVS